MLCRVIIAIAFAGGLIAQTPARDDVELMLWTGIKQGLTGPDGDEYFQSSMKDCMLPRLKGTLISALPTDSGNALVLGLTDSTTPEVAMLLHDLPSGLVPGMQVEFSAVPIRFNKDPFLVTFDTDKDSVVTKPFGELAPSWYVGPALGELKSGRYKSNVARVQFDLPSDWTLEGTHPSFDNGEVAILTNSSFVGAYAGVWMSRFVTRPAENAVYHTEHAHVLYYVRAAPDDIPIFQTHFAQIVSSVVVP
jgi:hypothetical protein